MTASTPQRPPASGSDLAGGVPVQDGVAQFPAGPLAICTAFAAVEVAAVAHLAGAQTVAVPQPGPVAVTASLPQGVPGVRVGQVAYAIGVVVDFSARDIAAGETNVERCVGVGTRHWGPPRAQEPRPAIPR